VKNTLLANLRKMTRAGLVSKAEDGGQLPCPFDHRSEVPSKPWTAPQNVRLREGAVK
jgi:hypothetical protein